MTRWMNSILTSLFVFVLWTAGSAYGQSQTVIKFNIPFQFSVGDRSLPPGDYSLVQPMQHFLVLRDARGRTVASTFTEGVEAQSAPAISKLRFYSGGGQNALLEVWQEANTTGQKLFPSGVYTNSYIAKRRSPEARQAAEGSQP
jgi:hypothetical protein